MVEEVNRWRRRFGVFGGTFDPIHLGHLVVAQEVLASLQLDRLFFLPAGDPPHKRNRSVTPAQHRVAMVRRAIAGNPAFALSLVDVRRPGPSFTVETLRLLHEQWGPETGIYFVLGWDMLDELLTWHDPPGVVRQVDKLVAVHRPGYGVDEGYLARLEQALPGLQAKLLRVETPQVALSSTELRERVAQGRPIRYLVPSAVERYIRAEHLYRTQTAPGQAFHQAISGEQGISPVHPGMGVPPGTPALSLRDERVTPSEQRGAGGEADSSEQPTRRGEER